MSVGERYVKAKTKDKDEILLRRYWEVLGGRHCVEPRICLLFLFLSFFLSIFLELINVLLFFIYCNFYQETSYLLGNVYMYIAPRIIGIYQEDWIGSSSASASPMLPPCYY